MYIGHCAPSGAQKFFVPDHVFGSLRSGAEGDDCEGGWGGGAFGQLGYSFITWELTEELALTGGDLYQVTQPFRAQVAIAHPPKPL